MSETPNKYDAGYLGDMQGVPLVDDVPAGVLGAAIATAVRSVRNNPLGALNWILFALLSVAEALLGQDTGRLLTILGVAWWRCCSTWPSHRRGWNEKCRGMPLYSGAVRYPRLALRWRCESSGTAQAQNDVEEKPVESNAADDEPDCGRAPRGEQEE